jgi:hypothetical protein
MFMRKTYRMLQHNKLTNRLFVFVANEKEHALYTAALQGCEYRDIIVGQLGGANAIRAICNYFPINQRIVFMDDDFISFFDYAEDGTFRKDSSELASYLSRGFDAIDLYGCGAFTCSFMQNKMWLRHKPRAEIRPFTLVGGFFGARNNPDMISTEHAHGDDIVRSVRYIDRYGGVLVFWWAGFHSRYGKEPGGMQASGDRGTDTLAKTHAVSWSLYNSDPLLQAYAMPPAQEKSNQFVSMKLKKLPVIKKHMQGRCVVRDLAHSD